MALSSERFRDIVLHALKRMQPKLRELIAAGNPLLVGQPTTTQHEHSAQMAALFGGLKMIFDSGDFDRENMTCVLVMAACFFADNLKIDREKFARLFVEFQLPKNAELIWTPPT